MASTSNPNPTGSPTELTHVVPGTEFTYTENPPNEHNLFEFEYADRIWGFVQEHSCSNPDCDNDVFSWAIHDQWVGDDDIWLDEDAGITNPVHSREGVGLTLETAKAAALNAAAAFLILVSLEDYPEEPN